MSRIDQALRRRGDRLVSGASPVREGEADPFSSPWASVRIDSARPSSQAAPPAPVTSLLDDREPATIPGFSELFAERLVVAGTNGALREQFAKLCGLLHRVQLSDGIKSVLVTSASPGDGKTLTAMNTALVLAGSYGRNVLLIDADLRRSSSQLLTKLGDVPGLNDVLYSPQDQRLPLVRLSSNLVFLPAGRPMADPLRGLTSQRMRRILEEASHRFDWVVVDAPPVGPVADVALLSEMVDSILFVVRAGATPHGQVQKAVEALGGQSRILGVVLNASEQAENEYNYSYPPQGSIRPDAGR